MAFVCAVIFLNIMPLANSELNQIRTYVRTNCLVKYSWLDECGVRDSMSNKRQCIQAKWLIQYIDYETKEETTIFDSKHWVNSRNYDKEDHRYRLDDYQV